MLDCIEQQCGQMPYNFAGDPSLVHGVVQSLQPRETH